MRTILLLYAAGIITSRIVGNKMKCIGMISEVRSLKGRYVMRGESSI
jgi:hypothetical protein